MAKGEETRQVILARALELANLVGVSGLSIGRLAEATSLSKSGLFAHFGSKEALEVAVVQEASRQFIEAVMIPALGKPRGEPRIRALFENWLVWGQRPGGCFFVGATSDLDDRPGPPRDALTQASKDWIDELEKAARIGVQEGHLREGLDVAQFAFAEYSLMLGTQFFFRFLDRADALARARRAFDLLLDAARPNAAPVRLQ